MFGDRRTCPYCGKKIKRNAIKCRFCGEFSESEQDGPTCVWCRVMIGVSLIVILGWLVVFLCLSG